MFTYNLVADDKHVEDCITEGILGVRVRPMLYQVVVDLLMAETCSECQGVFTIVGIAWIPRK